MLEKKELNNNQILLFREASKWETNFLGRQVTPLSIQYLVQYAKIKETKN